MLDENDIQKLLRLKRYEQPPAGYHERFLRDFQRRQRAEMLQQPLWRIALERMGAFFSDHSMGRLAYGSATAAVLLFAGVASYNMVEGGGAPMPVAANVSNNNTGNALAQNSPSKPYVVPQQEAHIVLGGNGLANQTQPTLPEPRPTQISNPHYIIDSRPVSYERPFTF